MKMDGAMAGADLSSPRKVAMLNFIYSKQSLGVISGDWAAREALVQRMLRRYRAGVGNPWR